MEKNKAGFSVIELMIVLTIAAILASLGFSGYMDSLRVQRRQDAVLSLQKSNLFINSVGSINQASSCSVNPNCSSAVKCNINGDTTAFPCISNNGFYCINYCATGFSSSNISVDDKKFLVATELLILQASPIANKGQDKDLITCKKIYISNNNNIYPTSCIK